MMREPKKPPRAMLTLLFAAIVFIIFFITMIIVGAVIYLLTRTGIINDLSAVNQALPIIIFALVSIFTGTFVATVLSSIPLAPISKLIGGMNQLASGDYEARLNLGGNLPITRDLSDSFNLLAGELQNTEMLRSDFVNNFSHEFKTPIVSIRGFAKLLLKSNPTDEQREYLEIITEESARLADMANGVLNLAKVENQVILTDVSSFNLSEQIRDCILLLEDKWSRKEVNITADFDEYMVNANEDLLKQVWINIIDNAIKFVPDSGEIGIDIAESEDMFTVSISNNGPEIGAEDARRIFNKYWQGDTSHASEGTGIGLSLAKRIAELHQGSITVTSSSQETAFIVQLPNM